MLTLLWDDILDPDNVNSIVGYFLDPGNVNPLLSGIISDQGNVNSFIC